jgi:DNA-binding MarR family transcriptional regulator
LSRGSQEHRQEQQEQQEQHVELLRVLAREIRRYQGLGASFFRAAAGRAGMTVTDMQVIDILRTSGALTAGQLADLTGLTTGAITGMLNRLEKSGIALRERDPEDNRRVIVRLGAGEDALREVSAIVDSLGSAWDEMVASYDDEHIAFLLEFLKRSNAITRQELARLREAPQGEEGISSTPLGAITSGQLVIPAGISRLTVRADARMVELYQARFEESVPDVKAKGGVVTIRYPRRLWMLGGQGAAEVTLNAGIPWEIVVRGGASGITAELSNLDLIGVDIKGGLSMIRLELPTPSRVIPIRINGGASVVTMHRPAGVPARVHLKGWASTFVFDEQAFSNMGADARLQSPGFDGTTPGYDIDVASSVSTVRITAG